MLRTDSTLSVLASPHLICLRCCLSSYCSSVWIYVLALWRCQWCRQLVAKSNILHRGRLSSKHLEGPLSSTLTRAWLNSSRLTSTTQLYNETINFRWAQRIGLALSGLWPDLIGLHVHIMLTWQRQFITWLFTSYKKESGLRLVCHLLDPKTSFTSGEL